MQLDQVEAGLDGRARRAHEIVAHPVHVRRGPSRGAPGLAADRAGPRRRSAASRLRPRAGRCPPRRRRVEPLRPAWPSCRPILAPLSRHGRNRRCRFHGAGLLVVPEPEAARRDARVRRDAGHLGEHQRRRPRSRGRPDAPDGNRPSRPSSAEYIAIGETTMRLAAARRACVKRREHRRQRGARSRRLDAGARARTSARSPRARPCRAAADSRG